MSPNSHVFEAPSNEGVYTTVYGVRGDGDQRNKTVSLCLVIEGEHNGTQTWTFSFGYIIEDVEVNVDIEIAHGGLYTDVTPPDQEFIEAMWKKYGNTDWEEFDKGDDRSGMSDDKLSQREGSTKSSHSTNGDTQSAYTNLMGGSESAWLGAASDL
jgi:hypothetical protein